MLSLFLLFDLSNDSAITTKKLQVCSIKLDTKVKALVMKEARFSKDLEMKDKRIANILERVKTLEQDKVQAAVVAREKLRSLEAERDKLLQINDKLQLEKESLMVEVSV